MHMTGIHIVVFTLWLGLASCYLLPKTKPPIVTKPPKFPAEFLAHGHQLSSELRLPNEKFCQDMQLKPYRQYMILPWWYVHCERLLEKEERLIRAHKMLVPIYGRILSLVQKHKQKQALLAALQDNFN